MNPTEYLKGEFASQLKPIKEGLEAMISFFDRDLPSKDTLEEDARLLAASS